MRRIRPSQETFRLRPAFMADGASALFSSSPHLTKARRMPDQDIERLKDLRDTLKEASKAKGLAHMQPKYCEEMAEVLERHIEETEIRASFSAQRAAA